MRTRKVIADRWLKRMINASDSMEIASKMHRIISNAWMYNYTSFMVSKK